MGVASSVSGYEHLFILSSGSMKHHCAMPLLDPLTASTPTAQDIGELLLLGLLWGASFLFMRVASPEFGPVALVALRVGVAGLLMAPLLDGVWRQPAARRWWRPIVLVGLFNSALPFCLFAYAALSLLAGFNAILNATVIPRRWPGAALWALVRCARRWPTSCTSGSSRASARSVP
jgi:EamA-like transporter family